MDDTKTLTPEISQPSPELTEVPAYVGEFERALNQARHPAMPVWELPAEKQAAEALTAVEHTGPLHRGLHLDPDIIGLLSGDEALLPAHFDFELNRARGFGAERSAHNVFFGDISYVPNEGDEPISYPVAIKQFEDDAQHHKAVHEYLHLHRLRAAGFNVFLPIGIVVNDNKAFLLTLWEDGLTTMDKENWEYQHASPKEKQLIETRLKDTAKAMAVFEVVGQTFHGDARTRNVLRTVEGQTRFIDFESAKSYPDRQSWVEAYKQEATRDIISLYKSLEENRGVFHTRNKKEIPAEQRHDFFRTYFMDDYVTAVALLVADALPDEVPHFIEALRSIQDSVYFAVYEDWDKRRLPPAKRDSKSIEPKELFARLAVRAT